MFALRPNYFHKAVALAMVVVVCSTLFPIRRWDLRDSRAPAGRGIKEQALAARAVSVPLKSLAFSRILGLRWAADVLALSALRFRDRIRARFRLRSRWNLHPKDVLFCTAFLSIFVGTAFFAYFRWHTTIPFDPLAERKSYAALTGAGGLAGGLLAQWLRIRSGKQTTFEWRSILLLMALNIGYSTFGEKPIYGDWLESIPGFWGLPGPAVQWTIDLLGISLFYTDPAAFLVYATYLDPRKELQAREEMRHMFLGFYLKYGWIWGVFLGAALAAKGSPIISFAFLQAGVLIWNVAFEHETYPSSRQVLDWVGSHRRFRWLTPIFRGIMKIHANPFYFILLRWTIIGIWLKDASHFLAQLGMSDTGLALFVGVVLASHLAVIAPAFMRRFSRRLIWVSPLIAIPAMAAAASHGAGGGFSHSGFSPAALAPIMFGSMIVAGVPADWPMTFTRRIRAAASQWKARRLMPDPEIFIAALQSLAEEVDLVLDASRPVKPDPDMKWIKRRDSLILLGQLAESWMDPAHAASIRLVATVCKSEKVTHWLLHMTNNEIGPAWAHVVTRANPKKSRAKITFWREGGASKRDAALFQYRIGWDQTQDAHVDVVRADKPSTASKAWVIHRPIAAFQRPNVPQNALHNGLRWVRELARQTALFLPSSSRTKPSAAFQWIPYPGLRAAA